MQYKNASRNATLISLSEAAREIGCTVQRASRTVKRLKIPILRMGRMVLISRAAMQRLTGAIKKAEHEAPPKTIDC